MARVVITNTTKALMFVGSFTIPPGETRDFEETDVPPSFRPQRAAAQQEQQAEQTPRPSLNDAIAAAAADSLAGRQYHGREDYVVGGISSHYKADPLEVREKLTAEIANCEAAAKDASDKIVTELAMKAAKDVIAAVPGLDDVQLAALEKLEAERKIDDKPAPRKTVLEAISEETLKRAGGGGGE